MTIRIFLVDRLDYILNGMAESIDQTEDIEVVGTLSNYEQILMTCRNLDPDILVIDPDDFHQSFNWGILERLRNDLPEVDIIVFTYNYTSEIINYAMNKVGIKGFVSKNDPHLNNLTDCIRYVYQGNIYIDPKLAGQYIKEQSEEDLDDLFSATQLNVFVKVSEGKSKKEIAEELELTERYVGNIVQEIRKKLKAKNDVELVHQAIKKGLVEVKNKMLRSSKALFRK